MALLLVIGPVFEADLCDEQYGFRPNLDAKLAIRRTFFHVTERGLTEVVDADLSDYFNTIPHGPLMRCLSRRIADGQVLSVIKSGCGRRWWNARSEVSAAQRRPRISTAARRKVA